ncbi:hypothetical protein WH47_11467 [Habropoda laboriosa]|uniref:Uncharacterized protein n=1 Tax=Habropoda laboriosa TaxID=597456 RepID=A0A0L7QL74_9HYME|nr:hypothetical protein WH47_11467 [Habropoda laboriosa]
MYTFLRIVKSCERNHSASRSCVVHWPSVCSHIYCVIRQDIISCTPANVIGSQDIWLFIIEGKIIVSILVFDKKCGDFVTSNKERLHTYETFEDPSTMGHEKTLHWVLFDSSKTAHICY